MVVLDEKSGLLVFFWAYSHVEYSHRLSSQTSSVVYIFNIGNQKTEKNECEVCGVQYALMKHLVREQ